ncbi:MAG TPA: hypothetical protein VK530_09100 [Candidatus Acidoferrum sp.]|nr:hypothetical protein [Candidatus Acidoferrum sp.]
MKLTTSVLKMDSLGVTATKVNRDDFIPVFIAYFQCRQRHSKRGLAVEVPRETDWPGHCAGFLSQLASCFGSTPESRCGILRFHPLTL